MRLTDSSRRQQPQTRDAAALGGIKDVDGGQQSVYQIQRFPANSSYSA
jgi:hypothetical protein